MVKNTDNRILEKEKKNLGKFFYLEFPKIHRKTIARSNVHLLLLTLTIPVSREKAILGYRSDNSLKTLRKRKNLPAKAAQ